MAKTPQKSAAKAEAEALGMAKLGSSGLTVQDAVSLRVRAIDAAAVTALHPKFKAVPALLIPYHHPLTRQPLPAREGYPPFYRLRYLKDPTDPETIALLSQGKKPPRYVQPVGTGTCAYYPLHPAVDWAAVAADRYAPIIVTEGEFKAAKACSMGFPTIGIGGVQNWRSAKDAVAFIDTLKIFNLVGRRINIIFDSDVETNESVCNAMNEIANEFMHLGAHPYFVPLPNEFNDPDKKTGLDDWLLNHPADELEGLISDSAYALTLAGPLLELNAKNVMVLDPGMVISSETDQKMGFMIFEKIYNALRYHERVLDFQAGRVTLRPADAATTWLKWPLRNQVQKLIYRPGQKHGAYKNGSLLTSTYNMWRGWGCESVKGDAKPFLEFFNFVFSKLTPEDRHYVMQWVAYPIKYPGTKLKQALIVFSEAQGTGKTMIFQAIGKIYGENYKLIEQNDLYAEFNSWGENRQFVLADDISGTQADRREAIDKLKRRITQEVNTINIKYVPSYDVPDLINYALTSNYSDALHLSSDDRRFIVVEGPSDPRPVEFYNKFIAWVDAGNMKYVRHYFENEVDFTGYDPNAPARVTDAKLQMIRGTKSMCALWAMDLKENTDHVLRLGEVTIKGDLFTAEYLLKIYGQDGAKEPVTVLARALREAGFRQVNGGKPVRSQDGLGRYWAIRNRSKWERATPDQIRAHLDSGHDAAFKADADVIDLKKLTPAQRTAIRKILKGQ